MKKYALFGGIATCFLGLGALTVHFARERHYYKVHEKYWMDNYCRLYNSIITAYPDLKEVLY